MSAAISCSRRHSTARPRCRSAATLARLTLRSAKGGGNEESWGETGACAHGRPSGAPGMFRPRGPGARQQPGECCQAHATCLQQNPSTDPPLDIMTHPPRPTTHSTHPTPQPSTQSPTLAPQLVENVDRRVALVGSHLRRRAQLLDCRRQRRRRQVERHGVGAHLLRWWGWLVGVGEGAVWW